MFDPDADGSPALREWLRAHPDSFMIRATFTFPPGFFGHHDKQGQPWPRDRWGNPMCPLDELPQGTVAPGTAPYDPCDLKSPWFDPVRLLRKVGFIPSDRHGDAHPAEPEASAPAAARTPDREPRREASAGEADAGGSPPAKARPLVPGLPSDARRVLPVSTADTHQPSDPAEGRTEPRPLGKEEQEELVRRDPPIRPVYPVEELAGVLAGGIATGLLPRALAAIAKQFLPDHSWLFGERSAEPSSNPAAPEAPPPPARSADVDRSIRKTEESLERRRNNTLDESDLSAADGDLRRRPEIPESRCRVSRRSDVGDSGAVGCMRRVDPWWMDRRLANGMRRFVAA